MAEERPGDGDEIGARRGGEPQDGRTKPDAAVGRGGDQEFFGLERGDDALHCGARETDPLGDLSEAQAVGLVFEGAQDRRRARDHLHLAVGLAFIIRRMPAPFIVSACLLRNLPRSAL